MQAKHSDEVVRTLARSIDLVGAHLSGRARARGGGSRGGARGGLGFEGEGQSEVGEGL